MLKVDDLQKQLESAIKNIIPPAIETCKINELPTQSKIGTENAKNFAETFSDLVCENLSKVIAQAIDYYIKNISITGTIITMGSPTTQTAIITAAPNPVTGGVIPNTFKIS